MLASFNLRHRIQLKPKLYALFCAKLSIASNLDPTNDGNGSPQFLSVESAASNSRIDGNSSKLGSKDNNFYNKIRNSSKKSARLKDDDEYIEIMLDIRDDTVFVQNIQGGDFETALLASRLEKRPSTMGSRLRQVLQELKRMTSSKRFNIVDRSKSDAARALRGLKFMTKNVGTNQSWSQVEKYFDELTVALRSF